MARNLWSRARSWGLALCRRLRLGATAGELSPGPQRSPSQVPKHSLWPALGPLRPDGSKSAPALLASHPQEESVCPKPNSRVSLPAPHAAGVEGLSAPGRPSPAPSPWPPSSGGKGQWPAGTRMSLTPSAELRPDCGIPVPTPQNCHSPGSNTCFLLN